jgi:hypothetical protein
VRSDSVRLRRLCFHPALDLGCAVFACFPLGFACWSRADAAFLLPRSQGRSESLGAIEEDLHDPSIALPTARGVARELLATLEQGWISAFIEVTDERGSLLGIIPMSDFLLQ